MLGTGTHLNLPFHLSFKDLSDHSKEGGWFSKLTSGLSKSSKKLTTGIGDIFTKKKLDNDTLEELEELLITADIGPSTAARLVETLPAERFGKHIEPEEVKETPISEYSGSAALVKVEASEDEPLFEETEEELGSFKKLHEYFNKLFKKLAMQLHPDRIENFTANDEYKRKMAWDFSENWTYYRT